MGPQVSIPTVMFSLKYFYYIFFFSGTPPSCVLSPCKIKKKVKVFTIQGRLRFVFPALYIHSLGRKVFHSFSRVFLGLLPKHGIVSPSASVLKGIDSDTLAMCAICSCLCGDRMAPNILFSLAPWGKTSASRLGRVRPADMGRGHARRNLRHNLFSTAQPLSPFTAL